MPTLAVDNRQFINEYFEALCTQTKTEELMDRYISDPHLKQHIRDADAAFPGYSLTIEQLVSEGDTVAVRSVFMGTHKGEFAGVPPTGKFVTAGVMLFYRITEGKIDAFWMQLDVASIMAQLTA